MANRPFEYFLTEEQRQDILCRYDSGQSMESMEPLFPRLQWKGLRRFLIANGRQIRDNSGRKVTPASPEEIVELYREGLSMKKIATSRNIPESQVRAVLIDADCCSRPRHLCNRKYKIDENVFAKVETEAIAYALGFIAGDGCVTRDRLTVLLARRDRDHLVTLADAIGAEAPIIDVEKVSKGKLRLYSLICINSKTMIRDLRQLGIVERKSLILRPWTGPDHLLRHFYRGLVDADGCLSKNRYGRWSVALVGSLWVVRGFRRFIKRQTGFSSRIHKRGNIYTVSYARFTAAQAVAKLLYKDVSVFLVRKQHKATVLMSEQASRIDPLTESKESLLMLLEKHGSWKAVRRAKGWSYRALYRLRRRYLGRSSRDWSAMTVEQLMTLKNQYGTWKEVAKHLNTDTGSLGQIRRRLGML